MNIIHSFCILIIGLLFSIHKIYSAKIQVIYEINVIPVNNNIFEAGVNNQIRIALWSKTRNYPVAMEEIEPSDNSLIEVVVFSKDLRSMAHFHMEDFPHYNNETNLPTTANYFDIDYIFPIAGDYTISIKCKPYKRSIRVNKDIHVEGKKETKMNLDNNLLPIDPNNAKVVYFKPVQLENVKSIYPLPLIPHTLTIAEKDLKNEVEKATGPIYGAKITIKNTLRSGFCSNVILEFFRVELKDGEVQQNPVTDLFQYANIPINAIIGNEENPDFDIVQGNILNTVSDRFPSCGSKISPPKEMVFGPNFGFSIPFRNNGIYQIIFQIAHSFNDNTYLLAPNVVVRVTEKEDDANYAPEDYIDEDSNYDEFVQNVIDKQITVPGSPIEDNSSSGNTPISDDTTNDGDASSSTATSTTDATETSEVKADEKPDDSKTDDKQDDTKTDDKQDDTKTDDKQDDTKTEENPDDSKTDNKQDDTKTDDKQDDSKIDDKQDDTKTEENPDDSKTDDKQDDSKTDDKQDDAKTEENPDDFKENVASPPNYEEDEPVPDTAHGKIIVIGVAGIITVSGLM